VGENAIGSIQWPILETPRNRRKNSADIFYTSRVIANFVSNFVGMATGVGQRKCNWQHSMAHSRNTPPPYRPRCKNLLHKPSYSPFCPKFRCHGNGGRSGKNAIGSIRCPIPKNPPIGAKISYASQVIVHFVPNFVAMATGVGRGKMQLAAFDGPCPKTPR